MRKRDVETAVILFGHRFMPPSDTVEQAKTLEASGVVDYLQICDQLVNFIPPELWTPANSPSARVMPDIDSCPDAFTLGAYCLGFMSKMKLTLTTDSIRRGPAELVQTMLTFADITKGNVLFQIGGGEAKQTRPYGWKRSEGLARMEDLFRAFHAFLDTDGPINLDGNVWKLQKAYLGAAKQYRPRLWGLGGGPKLMDLSTTYCDGVSAAAPCVWATPEQAAEEIAAIKKMLVAKDRDPEKFGFGIFCPVLLHEDKDRIDKALDNPLTRWMTSTYGRIDPADWAKEGLESPVPPGWTYYMKMVPYDTSPEFLAEVLRKSTHQTAAKGLFSGSPTEVAAVLQKYVDVGVTWVLPVDYMPLMLSLEEASTALDRSIEVCAILKGKQVVNGSSPCT